MSENSSDSESSCGWTIINHEGSDIETLRTETGDADLPLEQSTTFIEDLLPDLPTDLPDTSTSEIKVSVLENIHSILEEHQLASEMGVAGDLLNDFLSNTLEVFSLVFLVLPVFFSVFFNIIPGQQQELSSFGACIKGANNEECILGYDGPSETVSDDSDIVTLEPPKPDEAGTQEEEEIAEDSEMNMSFSSSSQYTFSQPETVYPARQSADNSSNDEASDDSVPVLRHRRSKRPSSPGTDSENKATPDLQEVPSESRRQKRPGNHLNKCIILALVIAISMGFGHFYGTVQVLERQKFVEKIYENEINDMKDDLVQCQKDQDATMDHKEFVEQLAEDLDDKGDMVQSLEGFMDKIAKENQALKLKHKELKLEANDLATNLKSTEVQNRNLLLENQHLRESLEKEEQALASLKEELRKLREQVRNLEEKGRPEIMQTENQKLKEHLKEERQKIRGFRTQKEALLTEAKFLRKELDNERQITDSLKVELEEMGNRRSTDATFDAVKSNQEIEHLKNRLSELEKKLNFEQQRSDLWERLYVEVKEEHEKSNSHAHQESTQKHKKKGKATFFNSVKDTFDAVKNSTKDFVRHHKEKIKQAKEAVKENLKKFSDSVKTTFRHFKDSTKSMFDKNRFRKHGERKKEETKEAHTVHRKHKPFSEKTPDPATTTHMFGDSQDDQKTQEFQDAASQHNDGPQQKGCSGVFECAHQESISLFNKVLDPVRVEEFHDLMQVYLLEQVDDFRHWKELEQFINKFFLNGIFIHDQMLFTDFVNDVEDYLEEMKEYQTNTGGVFEDLDKFVYRHFFGSAYSIPYGPRKPEQAVLHKERKQEKKHPGRYKREGRWQKHGRANGRHMASVEIELGQLPFDAKY